MVIGRGRGPISGRGSRLERRTAIVISANSLWNLVNFRRGLIEALGRHGYEVTAIAPDAAAGASDVLPCARLDISIDRKGMNPLRDLGLLGSYVRLLRRLRPAAYLSYTIKPNIYGALAARWLGVASMPNVSGLGTAFIEDTLLTRFVSRLYATAFRKSFAVFFQNPDDRDLFVGRGIVRPGQARLLPGSGIDLDYFAPAPPPAAGPPTYLFIGRLLGDKGVREFVEAARIVRVAIPEARFQLLGDVDDGNRTAIGRGELGGWVDEGIVDYLGHRDDVRSHVRDATAVVLPSYREGLPRTLLEGAALARPLVASDVPGNREIAIDGVTGLLCQARDAPSLADTMLRMAALSPERRAEMGMAARQLVERKYSERVVVESYLEALQQIMTRQGAR